MRYGSALAGIGLALLGACRSASSPPCAHGECVVDLQLGGEVSCALTDSGGAKCWGLDVGQFGVDPGTAGFAVHPAAVNVNIPDGTVVLAAGEGHLCALLADRTVKCWGLNGGATPGQLGGGQLGDGTTQASLAPVSVSGLEGAIALAAGARHTCALKSSGTVLCWGSNVVGQLGSPDVQTGHPTTALNYSTVPVVVPGLPAVVAGVAAGAGHGCAQVELGAVWCWGDNGSRQLGNPGVTAAVSAVPVEVPGLRGVASLALGKSHSCALLGGGSVKCWGSNASGQVLGTRLEPGPFSEPTTVPGVAGAVGLAAGDDHTCAVLDGGGVKCWGANELGQMGDGFAGRPNGVPSDGVSNLSGVSVISAGRDHTCALVERVGVRCWGYGWHGQLGNGTQEEASLGIFVPVEVRF